MVNIINKKKCKYKYNSRIRNKDKKIWEEKITWTTMNELIEDLKSIDVKVLLNSKFKYGYGDGVCLVLTQLCDKYLI